LRPRLAFVQHRGVPLQPQHFVQRDDKFAAAANATLDEWLAFRAKFIARRTAKTKAA
jgi:hypothetical protein